MGDAGVVAALGQRRHTGALDVLGTHARHLEQRDLGADGDHRVDAGSQVVGEELIGLGRAEHVRRAVDLDVEHIPRAEHDERHVGLAAAALAHSCCQPSQIENEFVNPSRALSTRPESCTPQPSTNRR